MHSSLKIGTILVAASLGIVSCGRQDHGESKLDAASSSTPSRSLINVVEFHIPAGTGTQSWNTEDQTLKVHVGDTLRIFNDDSVNHRLHTNGKPCAHGPTILPGASFDCVISRPYSSAADGPIYDHNVGETARFWLMADPAPAFLGDVLHEATISVAIPEVGDAEYRFMVDDTGFVDGLTVEVRIMHTYISDLTVSLYTPSGKQAILHNQEGGSADNIFKTYGIGGVPSPALAALDGEDINGEWRLFVHDGAAGDLGSINYIKLSGNRVLR